MIDIHCHILPGIDDGPLTLQTSLAMATIAAADGIHSVIATPHTDGIRVSHESVTRAVARLNRELVLNEISLRIYPGYEIPYHLVSELGTGHTLAGSEYVLVEFPHDHLPRGALNTFYHLSAAGLKPVIAHPERNHDVILEPGIMLDLAGNGVLVQLTAASITGELGPDIQRCARYFIEQDMVHFIATDSHSPAFREPVLSKAHKLITKIAGKDKCRKIFRDNPQLILGSRNQRNDRSGH